MTFKPQTRFPLQNAFFSGMIFRAHLNQTFGPGIYQVNLNDLDFVGAPGALCPSKSGVGCLDFVGLKCSCSNVFGFVQAVLVFARNVPTKFEPPTLPGQFLEVFIWHITCQTDPTEHPKAWF